MIFLTPSLQQQKYGDGPLRLYLSISSFKVYGTLAAYLLLIQLLVKFGLNLLQISISLSRVYLISSSELTLRSSEEEIK